MMRGINTIPKSKSRKTCVIKFVLFKKVLLGLVSGVINQTLKKVLIVISMSATTGTDCSIASNQKRLKITFSLTPSFALG